MAVSSRHFYANPNFFVTTILINVIPKSFTFAKFPKDLLLIYTFSFTLHSDDT